MQDKTYILKFMELAFIYKKKKHLKLVPEREIKFCVSLFKIIFM